MGKDKLDYLAVTSRILGKRGHVGGGERCSQTNLYRGRIVTTRWNFLEKYQKENSLLPMSFNKALEEEKDYNGGFLIVVGSMFGIQYGEPKISKQVVRAKR